MPLTSIAERRDSVEWLQQMYIPFAASCESDQMCEDQGWSVLQYAVLAAVGHRDLAAEKANALPGAVFESAGAMAILRATLYGTLQRGQMLTSHCDWSMSKSTRRANQPSQRRSMSLASAKRHAPSISSTPTQVVILVWNVLVGSCLPLGRAKLWRAVKWEVANGPMNAPPAILIGVLPLHLRDPNQPTRRNSTRVVRPVRQRSARANPIGVQDRCLRHSSASLDPTLGAAPKLLGVLAGVPNAAV